MKEVIYLFLFDGFSDWEISYLTPDLFKNQQFELKTFSISGGAVISAGGLKISPDLSLSEVDIKRLALLILPGGEAWEKKELAEINNLLHKVKKAGLPVAGICGATVGLADAGFLNNIQHTSNDKIYLKAMSPEYKGEKNYLFRLAVTDGNVITASGIAPVEFAREVFRKLKIFDEVTLEKWFQLFKNGVWTE
jgi:putative intracellular protease/amidase